VAVAPDGRVFGAYLSQGHQGLLCNADGTHWAASCPPVGDNKSPQPATSSQGSHGGTANSACGGVSCPTGAAAEATGSAAPSADSGKADAGNGPDTTLTTAHAPTSSTGKTLAIGALIAAVVLVIAAGVVTLIRRRRAKPLEG